MRTLRDPAVPPGVVHQVVLGEEGPAFLVAHAQLGDRQDVRRAEGAQALALVEKQGVAYTIDEVKVAPNDNVGWLVKGTFQPPGFLDKDNSRVRDEEDGLIVQDDWPSYDFTLLIPPQGVTEGGVTEGGLPLGLIGHGLFGTGDHPKRLSPVDIARLGPQPNGQGRSAAPGLRSPAFRAPRGDDRK